MISLLLVTSSYWLYCLYRTWTLFFSAETEPHHKFPLTKQSVALAIRTAICQISYLVAFHTEQDQRKEMYYLITCQKLNTTVQKKKKKLVAVSFTQLTNGYQINKSTCISAIRQPGWIWLDHNKFLFDQDETTVNQIVFHFSISWLFLMMLSPSYDHSVYLPASINCCFIVWGELSCEKYYRNWTYYLFISVFLLWLPL